MKPRSILLAGIVLGALLFACSCTSSLRPVECPESITVGDQKIPFFYFDGTGINHDSCMYQDSTSHIHVEVTFYGRGSYVTDKSH